jgi:hypothetical protein
MAGNIADSLDLLTQAMFKDHELGHGILTHPYDYATKATPLETFDLTDVIQKMGLAPVAKYWAVYPNLVDRQFSYFRCTQDGRLMVDATVAVVATFDFGYPVGDYLPTTAVPATPAETHVAHPFTCRELTIMNDGLQSVFYDFATPVNVATAHELLAGEAFVDERIHTDVYLTCGGGLTTDVRVWGRGTV